jgi:CheY-like chemotaxis protein/anti-sigma regulatory factor (Ser/Thr protein kinase)
VDPAAVVQAAIDTVRPAAEAKRIQISSSLEPGANYVHGDPTRLQQAAWNLLSNAIKFTPREGRVRVSVARANSHVEIVVSDTGHGIAGEFLPEIFDRFRQADGSSSRGHEGLGLGLAIVKQLVELHGGTIRAESEGEGKGATFTIVLPLSVPPALAMRRPDAGDRPPLASTLPRLDSVTVLVVDDQADAAAGTARLLESAGARVLCSHSVDAALAVMQTEGIDVIVSDIGMPQRDGYDFIRSLRTMGDRTPLVALTAYARSEDRSRSLMEGFEVHVSKPADPAELIIAVAAVYARARKHGS